MPAGYNVMDGERQNGFASTLASRTDIAIGGIALCWALLGPPLQLDLRLPKSISFPWDKTMDNPLILGTVQSLIDNFYARNNDGSTAIDHETREIVKRKFEHLRLFLHNNNLLTISLLDNGGNLIDVPLRKADLTEEGLQLLRNKMAGWLNSKASDADPPKMAVLERALAVSRREPSAPRHP